MSTPSSLSPGPHAALPPSRPFLNLSWLAIHDTTLRLHHGSSLPRPSTPSLISERWRFGSSIYTSTSHRSCMTQIGPAARPPLAGSRRRTSFFQTAAAWCLRYAVGTSQPRMMSFGESRSGNSLPSSSWLRRVIAALSSGRPHRTLKSIGSAE